MKYLYLLFSLFILPIKAIGQLSTSNNVSVSFQAITLMDISPAGNIILTFTPPVLAGKPISNPIVNDTKYIKYTSSIATGGSNRRITASINQLIPGINLKILIANSSSGLGTLGIPTSSVTLSTTPKNIITGIGGSYTGAPGHRVTLSADVSDYHDLRVFITKPVTITYTITE